MEVLGLQLDVVFAIFMLAALALVYPLTKSKWAAILGVISWGASLFFEGSLSNIFSFVGMLLWVSVLVGLDVKKLKKGAQLDGVAVASDGVNK